MHRKALGVVHQHHEHIAGVWDNELHLELHPVWRGREEVPLVLVGMEEGGGVRMGSNKWWTEWLRMRRAQGEEERTQGNNDEENDSSTCSSGKASILVARIRM